MNINKPKNFTPRQNQRAKDWQIWKDEFIVYLRLSNCYGKFSEEQRALLLINIMGTEAIKAMDQIVFEDPANDRKDMDILLAKFDEFFNPPLNEIEERFKFFSRRKSPNEDLDRYLLEMKDKAEKCNFGNQSEKFIIDMFILSMDNHAREFIWGSELKTLEEILCKYKQHQINEKKMAELSAASMKRNSSLENLNSRKLYTGEQKKHFPAKRICSKCGSNHPYKECPAFHAICQNCLTKGHYSHKCKQTPVQYNQESKVSNEQKSQAKTTYSKEESKPSTSGVKQHCSWCGFYHVPGTCPHDATCPRCTNFPHNICFNCKKNPHEQNCYYKNILSLPAINNTNANRITPCTNCKLYHGTALCKYCTTCQVYGHWERECPVKYNQYHARPHMTELDNGFVEVSNTYRGQAQARAQQPTQVNQNQRRQYQNNSKNNKKKEDNACCIS